MESPAPTSQIDNENFAYAQTLHMNMTPDRHPPVEIVDISSNPIPQRINLARIAQLEHNFDDGYDSNDYIGPFNDAVELKG